MIVQRSDSACLRPQGRGVIGWSGIIVMLCCICRPGQAETLDQSGLETVPSRLSITPSPYVTVRGVPNVAGGATTTGSLSYLDRPLSVVVPTAESDGTHSHVVAGALVFEMAVARFWSNGLDAGLGFGAHLYQFGDGLRSVTGQQEPLPHFGALDPMLEVGYRRMFGRTALRALGAVYLPLGSPRAFSGERRTRGEVGLLLNQRWPRLKWGAELSFLYRPLIDLDEVAWGPQLKLALAGRVRIVDQLWLGPEFLLRPQLARQPHHTTLLPNLLLAALEYRKHRTQIMVSYAAGLPLSGISNEISKQRSVRAPTTPIQQVSVSVQFTLDWSHSDSEDALIDVNAVP